MTTQLRLVDTPELRPRPARGKVARATSTAPARARSRRASTGRRAAASWGDWRLDAGTRQVGRAGVAQARRALEAVLEQTAQEQELSKAS